jgi:putative intracellular protease/amidase
MRVMERREHDSSVPRRIRVVRAATAASSGGGDAVAGAAVLSAPHGVEARGLGDRRQLEQRRLFTAADPPSAPGLKIPSPRRTINRLRT